MPMWADRRLLDLFGIEHPILQAPMASRDGRRACDRRGKGRRARRTAGRDAQCGEVARPGRRNFGSATANEPVNLNFFAHKLPVPNNAREHAWREKLKPYYAEFGIDPSAPVPTTNRTPFNSEMCAVVEELKPDVVSFHYGLPEAGLVERLKAAGCKVICSATTVAEARSLEKGGCDAVIAQGIEAGGHRGMFLSDDIATQVGLFALLPQVVDAVKDAGHRDGWHWRCAWNCRGIGDGRCRRTDRHGIFVLPGSEDIAAASCGAADRARRQHRTYQCHQRPARSWADQSAHSRNRAHQPCCP